MQLCGPFSFSDFSGSALRVGRQHTVVIELLNKSFGSTLVSSCRVQRLEGSLSPYQMDSVSPFRPVKIASSPCSVQHTQPTATFTSWGTY